MQGNLQIPKERKDHEMIRAPYLSDMGWSIVLVLVIIFVVYLVW
jgi:hypothetical protein